MNFFNNPGDLARGMMNLMNANNVSFGNEKEQTLRKNLQSSTYPDETKYMIEKAAKQVFHVYPFFNADILMFTESGFPRRYIQLKGLLEVDVKGKTCKVDFNMMMPNDYPRSAPYVRIVNRNPEYKVDPFYQSLQSKSDKSSYILNERLNSCKSWHPSNSLVNVVIECYDILKSRFPFSKGPSQNGYGGNNVWGGNNNGGHGFINPNTGPVNNWNGNNWGTNNNNNWGNNAGNNAWGTNNVALGGNNNNNANQWGTNNNAWGTNNNNQWGGNSPNGGMGAMGGMGGIINSNPVNTIAAAQKFAGKQKQTLGQLSVHYVKLLDKTQVLDATRQSLQSEESKLRRQNFDMVNFLSTNEQGSVPDFKNIVIPSNELSEQILDLVSSLKAREECVGLLETRFVQEQMSLQQFMKQLRKVEQVRFEQKALLQMCLKNAG